MGRKIRSKDVAIIGMACRFPGALNYYEYWLNLNQGICSIKEIPPHRWDDDFYSPDINEKNKSVSKWCGMLENIDQFDNRFFNISPIEAQSMDPHQRLLLEEAWHCVEDSGVSLKKLQDKRTSVYVGAVTMENYQSPHTPGLEVDSYTATGLYNFMLPNRISYFFGLSGESKTIDTACSSSVVALHDARCSLISGQTDYALVAGVNVNLSPFKHLLWSKNRLLSPDGQYRTFDANANGIVPGDGIGVLLLQPLSKAIEDNNKIYGVIKGTAVNHAGRTMFVSAPRMEAQRDLVLAAYKEAGFGPDTVTYMEAHGMGTPLGDPIEIEALSQAFRQYTTEKHYCKIGSVKPNVGHLVAASGFSGVFKVLLMLKFKKIAPTLKVDTLNPLADFEGSPFVVANELCDWHSKNDRLPLRAGVNSFGFGGVYSHVLLEEFEPNDVSHSSKPETSHLFILSAKSSESLRMILEEWKVFSDKSMFSELQLEDICATLATGRVPLPYRYGVHLRDKNKLKELLTGVPTSFTKPDVPEWCIRIGNINWEGLPQDLLSTHRNLFKKNLQVISECLDTITSSQDLRNRFVQDSWDVNDRPLFSFMVNYIIISTLMDLGLKPSLIAGEETGLWNALVLTGMIKLEDVLGLLSERKQLTEIQLQRPKIPFYDQVTGKVIKPFNFDTDYLKSLTKQINLPSQVVRDLVDKARLLYKTQFSFKRNLEEWDSVKSREKISLLLHDDQFLTKNRGQQKNERLLLAIAIMSSVRKLSQKWNLSEPRPVKDEGLYELLDLMSDGLLSKEALTELLCNESPDYLSIAEVLNKEQYKMNWNNPYPVIRNKCRNLDEINEVCEWIQKALLIKGELNLNEKPAVLKFGMIEGFDENSLYVNANVGEDLNFSFKETLLQLWLQGVNIYWEELYPDGSFEKLSLPVYAFERQSFQLPDLPDVSDGMKRGERTAKLHPLIDMNVSDLTEIKFTTLFNGNEFYLTDHVVKGQQVLPAAACLEMARAAAEQAAGVLKESQHSIGLKNVVWARPIMVGNQPVRVNIGLFPEDSGEIFYEIYTQPEASGQEPEVYSQGSIALDSTAETLTLDIEALKAQLSQNNLSSEQCYDIFKERGIDYGPGYRGIETMYVGQSQALAKLILPFSVSHTLDQFVLHPSLMVSALQASMAFIISQDYLGLRGDIAPELSQPSALRELEILGSCNSVMWALVCCSDNSHKGSNADLDIDLCDEYGKVCVRMKGVSTGKTYGEVGCVKPISVPGTLTLQSGEREQDNPAMNSDKLLEKVQVGLAQTMAALIRVKMQDIDTAIELSEYGFDSVMLIQFANNLNQEFALQLSPTIFFEYPTLKGLAKYLAQEYKSVLVSKFSIPINDDIPEQIIEDKVKENLIARRRNTGFAKMVALSASKTESRTFEPIAIVGMSGTFPMARDLNGFWKNVVEGNDCITEIPKERWDWQDYYGDPAKEANKTQIKWGGFIDGVDEFDPLFFRISPKEAELMDPQLRLLLQCIWKAMEDAAFIPGDMSKNATGVFIAASPNDYMNVVSIPYNDPLAMTVVYQSMIPNRISYALNLHGPSEYHETGCSSALVALHRAVHSIHNGECTQAIVGAVNLLLSPTKFIGFSSMGYLSPEGKTKSFQSDADGFVRSEGVGAVIIKPLQKAIEDHDSIYAVIKGTGVFHGGKGMSLTAPNAHGMKAAMVQAYKASKIDPRTVSYIEAHGIASALGDGIEINALKSGYQELADQYSEDISYASTCCIGSVKPAIGHGEIFSGMAELMKVALSLRHKLIPGVPGFKSLNENISLQDSQFLITGENQNWEPLKDTHGNILPRRASFNSYGFGGVNAHVVLEEYIPPENEPVQAGSLTIPQVVVFSAKTQDRLLAVVQQMLEYIELNQDICLENFAYTLQAGREAMESRVAMVVRSREELVLGIKAYLKSAQEKSDIEDSIPIFTGDLQEEHTDIRNLLTGKVGESLLQVILAEKDFEKLAVYWAKGGVVPWELLHEKATVRRMSLPTYPFERKRYWISQVSEQRSMKKEDSQPPINHAEDQLKADMSTYIKQRVSQLLGIPLEELPVKKPLNSLGFDSIQAVTLRFLVEQDFGIEIPLAVFSQQKTIEHLEIKLNEIISSQPTAELQHGDKNQNNDLLPIMIPNIADRFQPFPLNDIQESVLTGRKLRFGGDWVGCHIYLDIEQPKLDIYRLNKAWEQLIEYHDMLRCVILSDGQQQILERVSPYRFKVTDLRRKTDKERAEHLENIRKNLSHKVYECEQWPLFEVRITICPDKYIIHFSIDEFIVDGAALFMLLQQWQQLYENLEFQLPELTTSFRDYCFAIKKFEQSKRYKRDLEYWTQKLENMPGGPILAQQQKTLGNRESYYRTRLKGTLEEKQWICFKKKADELNVSVTTLLLTVFAEVLRSWSNQDTFSLILTYFNRPPIHDQLNQILGPFISTNIFVIERKNGRDFKDIVIENQECLWNDLDHSSVSGIRALRELKANHKISGSLYLPVVFTSLVNNAGTDQEGFFKHVSFMVSQTPQVYLDYQVFEQDGKLKFSWDVAEEYFGPTVIRDMFFDYSRIIKILSEEGDNCDLEQLMGEMKNRKLAQAKQGVLPQGLTLELSPEDRSKSFSLTDQQQAYVAGRNKLLSKGYNGCLLYQEIEVDNLDVNRLEQAWFKLMQTHEMLVTVIQEDGKQRLLQEVPEYKIRIADLTGKSAEEVQAELSETKRVLIERESNLEWPHFDLSVSVLDETKSHIHFSIDMVIADAYSIQLLLNQLLYYYDNPDIEPHKPGLLFRDYVCSLAKYTKTPDYRRSIQYWTNKFTEIPPGPQLPTNKCDVSLLTGHKQLKGIIHNWEALKVAALKLSVPPGMILLTAYTEVIAEWLEHRPFTIVIPTWQRLPLHSDINEVVGDFTALSWVSVGGKTESFEKRLYLNHSTVQEDLSHRAVSGLQALRKVAMRRGYKGILTFPIVFTDIIPRPKLKVANDYKKVQMMSSTPQVYLDNISEEHNSQLFIYWDIVDGVYPEGMIEDMFSGYLRILESLTNDAKDWNKIDFVKLINAQPQSYRSLIGEGSEN